MSGNHSQPSGTSGRTLVTRFLERVADPPPGTMYRFLESGDVDGPTVSWTMADLDLRARAIASRLQADDLVGQRALLLFAPGLDFVAAFWGCVLAGVVAVPAYPPDPSRVKQTFSRLTAIAGACTPRVVLGTRRIADYGAALFRSSREFSGADWIAVDDVAESMAATWTAPDPDPAADVYLQYTSGSTGAPKGVRVAHDTVFANVALAEELIRIDRDTRGVCWVPLYHDMGLLAYVLGSVVVGFEVTFLSPLAFIQRPTRWVEAMSHFRGTHSAGPNFGYELCSRKAEGLRTPHLDLSAWCVAGNGAEPVRYETLRKFEETWAPHGFSPGAWFPTFGMAESALFVTAGKPFDAPRPCCISTRTHSPKAACQRRRPMTSGPGTS